MRSDSIEQYRLAIHVKTVVELWKEYKTGIPHRTGVPAGLSIQKLDERFGAKWRTRDDCRKAYSRWRHIWKTIIQTTENLNLSSDVIAVKMDRWRENQGYTLQRLNSALADSRKHDSKQSGLWGFTSPSPAPLSPRSQLLMHILQHSWYVCRLRVLSLFLRAPAVSDLLISNHSHLSI